MGGGGGNKLVYWSKPTLYAKWSKAFTRWVQDDAASKSDKHSKKLIVISKSVIYWFFMNELTLVL